MNSKEDFNQGQLAANYFWLNEPEKYQTGNGLEIWTMPQTDFWQRTHYGFRNDNGHCLLQEVTGDFCLTTQVEFRPTTLYDQCGLIIRLDENNWIKASTEYINEESSKLGSVVTNLGYSDWATQDIASSINQLWYRISRQGQDFLIEASATARSGSSCAFAICTKQRKQSPLAFTHAAPWKAAFTAGFTFCKLDLINGKLRIINKQRLHRGFGVDRFKIVPGKLPGTQHKRVGCSSGHAIFHSFG